MTIPFVPLLGFSGSSGISCFFTTRQGGVSEQAYFSCNLGDHVGDSRQNVLANRQRLAAALGLDSDQCCWLRQVHGRDTVTITEPLAGLPPVEADAMVTNQSGLLLGILTADCLPLLFMDGGARVIGAAHAGWRGALAGVVPSCLEAMARLGGRSQAIRVIMGPCIRQDAYQVGEEHYQQFIQHDTGNGRFFAKKGSDTQSTFHFDLAGYVTQQLTDCGIMERHIDDVGLCTFSREEQFFSHRRAMLEGQKQCGRQMGGIWLH
ncbi:MAG: peptidoglycan editing factor PgeF [Magnetococcales bacterium]|nr:peptidoglycan editing factor PgeF [Magnetococcales bacterium]